MLFNIKLSCSAEELCSAVDNYIKEDYEFVLPAYGAFKSLPKGFRLRRKGLRIYGLYRKDALDRENPSVRYLPKSNHTNFTSKIITKKDKSTYLRGFCYPQLYQIFLAVLLAALGYFFSLGGINRTMPIVTAFFCAFLFIALDILRGSISTSKLLTEFIKKLKS